MILRPQCAALPLLLLLLLCLTYMCFQVALFCSAAWLQDYAPYSALHTVLPMYQNRSESHKKPAIVPKIIHQTWKNANVPVRWMTTRAMCRRLYGDFEYRLWTDESLREFLSQHYPWFLSVYDEYPYDIQRVDAARYFVLLHFGGIYLDLDVGCIQNWIRLLQFPMLLPVTKPVGVSNDVMFAAPGHKFLKKVVRELPNWSKVSCGLPFLTVFLSTGPAFLSHQAGIYMKESNLQPQTRDGDILESNIYFLDHSLYASGGDEALFYHIHGSSWHAVDAKVLSFVYNNHLVVMFGILPICLCSVFLYRRLLQFDHVERIAANRRGRTHFL